MPPEMEKVQSLKLPVTSILIFMLLLVTRDLLLVTKSFAAPCYGTRMPAQNEIFAGLQNYNIFNRDQENDLGRLRSSQSFLLISYGVFDWLSIDLKGGAGNIKQHPGDSDEVDYVSNFAGGYGYRLKLYDRDNTRIVFGFQHISVHPHSTHLGDVKHRGILDDWQYSLLFSKGFAKLTPYLGARWSRVDYIHWVGSTRKRVMSDLTKGTGLIIGCDIPIKDKTWLNLEGQFLDGESLAFSLNHSF